MNVSKPENIHFFKTCVNIYTTLYMLPLSNNNMLNTCTNFNLIKYYLINTNSHIKFGITYL